MLCWGILSVADINQKFIPPVLKSPRSILVAVGSRSLEKAKNHAEKWNIPRYYGSYEEVINDKEVNAVYIPLPNSLHVEWAVKAAAKGKHCLVEKPLSPDGEGVRQLQKARDENKVIIEEAFVNLHHPMFTTVKDTMSKLGEIKHLHGYLQSNKSNGDQPIIFNKELGSGGIWMLGAYPISSIIFLVHERPTSVCAQYKLHSSGVDETVCAVMKFPSGIIASITSSLMSHPDSRLEITGADGVIRLDRKRCFHVGQGEKNNEFTLITPEGQETITASDEEAFAAQLRAFEEVVLDGRTPISLELSEWIAETLEASVRSAETETFVKL